MLGFLFGLAGLGQIWWGVAILRRRTAAVALLGFLLQVSVVMAWLLSRTAGLPFGSEAWQSERIGLLDGITTVAELPACYLAEKLRTAARDGGRPAPVAVHGGLTLAMVVRLGAGHNH